MISSFGHVKNLLETWIASPLPGMVLSDADADVVGALVARAALSRAATTTLALFPNLPEAELAMENATRWLETLNVDVDCLVLPEIGDVRRYIPENEARRAEALDRAVRPGRKILFSGVAAALDPAPPRRRFEAARLELKVGDTIVMSELLTKLVAMDYDDEIQVAGPCEFARRGGLVDIFSPGDEGPARVEFWGDQIESIRLFSPETQRSAKTVETYRIIPRAIPGEVAAGDIFEYLEGPLTLVVFPGRCREHLETFRGAEALKRWDRVIGEIPEDRAVFLLDPVESAAAPPHAVPCGAYPPLTGAETAVGAEVDAMGSKLHDQLLRQQLFQWLDTDYRVILLGRGEGGVEHAETWAREQAIPLDAVTIAPAPLTRGVVIPDRRLAVLTEREIFYSPKKRDVPLTMEKADADVVTDMTAIDFAELDYGDYVVHLTHGIGQFRGVTELEEEGHIREVMELEYDDNVIVYVPTWQAHLVTRYIGSKKTPPRLSKVGGRRWGKTKLAAARSARAIAAEMLRSQALRAGGEGFRFPDDDREQRLFEESFIFPETPDQRRASEELKKDMAAAKPMDRLLCGDVGFGKTEVAIRGAFKAVMAGKQVAVLVPTTILAQQHYYSFRERFAEYPVTIDALSRFRTRGEQKQILDKVADGKIDIVIGTHRLLQEDVKFSNLGLVIIDEEQRFGVMHKEKFKRMRATVDILTMTATPIPRTLYMAMSGVRDMSAITTAPGRRLPTQTIVCQYDDALVREAITREIQRGGQAFYLHNRVKSIEAVRDRLAAMVPEARFAIGHGQMKEDELEQAMSDFLDHKVDVLICTTIIESGLDIPNANTILIERADCFGLAELYQLRGRVGRWTRQAYAYLMLPRHSIVTGAARDRLAAMRRYTRLGEGFRLAMKDLEIRGAGNILGADQSGQINAIGFELYCQLLKAEVAGLKRSGDMVFLPHVDMFIDFLDFGYHAVEGHPAAGFPPDYIPAEKLRIDFYRRCGRAVTIEEIDRLEEEARDRFGDPPQTARNFFLIQRIRLRVARAGYHALSVRDGNVFIEGPGRSVKLVNGKIPRLRASDPVDALKELAELTRAATPEGG